MQDNVTGRLKLEPVTGRIQASEMAVQSAIVLVGVTKIFCNVAGQIDDLT